MVYDTMVGVAVGLIVSTTTVSTPPGQYSPPDPAPAPDKHSAVGQRAAVSVGPLRAVGGEWIQVAPPSRLICATSPLASPTPANRLG